MDKPIIATGHPYAFPYYFRVFEYLKNKPPHSLSEAESECGGKDDFIFILPKLWLAKRGKVRVALERKPGFNVYGLRAVSYGGRGLGGLLKGWLLGIVFLLPYLKLKYKSKVLYSCSEPNLLTTFFNGIMAKLCGLRYVIFTWQNVAPEKYMSGLKLKVYRTLVGFNLRLADGVICGNHKAEQIIKGFKFQVSGSRTIVCPLAGVDTEKFKPGITVPPSALIGGGVWREKLGIKPEEKLILFYGALDKRKGLDVLINSFSILNSRFQILDSRLLIVGTGPEKQNLESRVGNLEIHEKVKFLDWLPNDQLPALL